MSRGGARVWGNDHPAAQLTEAKVIRYRNLVRSGKATVGELAAKEGCSHGRISMAVRGETWQHLNDIAAPVPAVQRRTAATVAAMKQAPAKLAAVKQTATKRTATKRTVAKVVTGKTAAVTRSAVKRPAAKRPAASDRPPRDRPRGRRR